MKHHTTVVVFQWKLERELSMGAFLKLQVSRSGGRPFAPCRRKALQVTLDRQKKRHTRAAARLEAFESTRDEMLKEVTTLQLYSIWINSTSTDLIIFYLFATYSSITILQYYSIIVVHEQATLFFQKRGAQCWTVCVCLKENQNAPRPSEPIATYCLGTIYCSPFA